MYSKSRSRCGNRLCFMHRESINLSSGAPGSFVLSGCSDRNWYTNAGGIEEREVLIDPADIALSFDVGPSPSVSAISFFTTTETSLVAPSMFE